MDRAFSRRIYHSWANPGAVPQSGIVRTFGAGEGVEPRMDVSGSALAVPPRQRTRMRNPRPPAWVSATKMEPEGCRPDTSGAFRIVGRMIPGLQPLNRFNAPFPGAVPQAGIMPHLWCSARGCPTARFVQMPHLRFVRGPTAQPHPSLWHRHRN